MIITPGTINIFKKYLPLHKVINFNKKDMININLKFSHFVKPISC